MKPPTVAAVIAVLLAAAPLAAAPATLDDVRASLRATTTMTAAFTQTAANGAVMTGRLLLARPGRIRFQYEPPTQLVVANGKRLSIVDYQVATVYSYPIRSTPLGILLDADPDLGRVAHVAGQIDGGVVVEARDAKHPEYGVLTLTFVTDAAAPGGLKLTGWTALDPQNNRTEVSLRDVRYNVAIPATSWTFRDPRTQPDPGRR
jgi:outer membrane lipoprotein-sorting protein